MSAAGQIPFDFGHRPSTSGEDFLIAPSNRDAVAWIDKYPDWPAPALIVYGPPGCGKSHLTQVFRGATAAAEIPAARAGDAASLEAAGRAGAAVIDDAEEGLDEEGLLHLYNFLAERSGHLLLTAPRAPARWNIALADLRSRLLAAPAVEIGRPEDGLIAAVLVKLFSDRQLRVDAAVIDYMVVRMERSLDAARRLVEAIDGVALAEKRDITVPLIRGVLSGFAPAAENEGAG